MSPETPERGRDFSPRQRVRAFAYLRRVYAGETPECDAGTAAFVAGMMRGVGSAMQQRARSLTKEQADAAFLQWVADQHALWASVAAMDGAEPEAPGEEE